jgi:TBC1 domain family member 15
MTIELDTTLAQAEVLFLSFAQIIADIDRRRAEEAVKSENGIRRRGTLTPESSRGGKGKMNLPVLSDNLRDLLKVGR